MKHPPFTSSPKWGSVLTVLALVLMSLVEAQEDNQIMHECRGVELDLVEEHAFAVSDCLGMVNATSIKDIGPSQFACVGKCVLEKTGLVDDEGHPHRENIFKMITDILPPEVHDDMQKKYEKCLDEETADLDPKEESCVSYLPLMMCFHLAFLEECM